MMQLNIVTKQQPELPEDEKLAADAIRIQAAVKIQANYRGYIVRSGKWDSIRNSHIEAITDDDKLRLKKIQTAKQSSASPQTKQHWYQSSLSPTSKTPRTSDEDAVTKIQAGYQGYKVRKEAKTSRQRSQKLMDKTEEEKHAKVLKAHLLLGSFVWIDGVGDTCRWKEKFHALNLS